MTFSAIGVMLLLTGQVSAMNYYYKQPVEKLAPLAIPNVSIPIPAMDCLTATEQKERNIHYCPEVSSLSLQGTTWSAPGNWKSYQVSFISQVNRFLGAQWTGTNVGRTVCLYAGDNSNDFPVELVFPALATLPDLPIWETAADKNGSNCMSKQSRVCDCPIQVFQQEIQADSAKAAVMSLSSN